MANCVEVGQFGCGKFDGYKIILEKESMIFRTMNLLESTHNIMIAKIWIPAEKEGALRTYVPSFVSVREM